MFIFHPDSQGFPDSSVGKESGYNAGDPGSIPGLGRSAGEGKGYPLRYSHLENSTDYSPWESQSVGHDWAHFTHHPKMILPANVLPTFASSSSQPRATMGLVSVSTALPFLNISNFILQIESWNMWSLVSESFIEHTSSKVCRGPAPVDPGNSKRGQRWCEKNLFVY